MRKSDHARVARRTIVHFPGFEPLTASQHHQRFERAATKTAKLWDVDVTVGRPETEGPFFRFKVTGAGTGWHSEARVHIIDHNALVSRLNGQPLHRRLVHGYRAGASVVGEGGAVGYFRHAWRFGLFFVFPFLVMALAIIASLAIILLPFLLKLELWLCGLGLVLSPVFYFRLVLPWFRKFHVLHLFADWQLAVAVARLDQDDLRDWLAESAAAVADALRENADEYVLTSHSMGSALAAHVLGMVLEREPDILKGKRVIFVTLGGAILQASLLKSASTLRARVGAILRHPAISFVEVQCLTDVISFYKSRIAPLTGHPDAPAPRILFIRLKYILSAQRYRRIRYDFLRIHRQYVLDADQRTNFDFVFMTLDPQSAEYFGLTAREVDALEQAVAVRRAVYS